jgi:predicted transposase YdaD
VANKVKAKSAHPATPSAANVVDEVAVVVVNALRMPIKPPLQSAMSRATMAARKAVQKDAMNADLSAIVALMKTATTRQWSKTPKPLSA